MAKLTLLAPYETTWEAWLLGGGPKAAFEDPDLPLEVEIGPGEDDHLYDSAVARPEVNWLGIEYSHKRVTRYVRKIKRRGAELPNLRIIWRPALDLIGPFLSPGVVSGYHIYFPDPWPKAHHARYRLLTPAFTTALRESLVVGGCVDLATDSAEYADEKRAAFDPLEGMRAEHLERERDATAPGARTTVFEEQWRAMGREIQFLRYRKEA